MGPKADGTIPEIQKKLILNFGAWLKINGESIYGTRPWKIAEVETAEGIPVPILPQESEIFMILLEKPQKSTIIIKNLDFPDITGIQLIGSELEVKWGTVENTLVIDLSSDLSDSHAYAFKITL